MDDSIAHPAEFGTIKLLQASKWNKTLNSALRRRHLSDAVEDGSPTGEDETLSEESVPVRGEPTLQPPTHTHSKLTLLKSSKLEE